MSILFLSLTRCFMKNCFVGFFRKCSGSEKPAGEYANDFDVSLVCSSNCCARFIYQKRKSNFLLRRLVVRNSL